MVAGMDVCLRRLARGVRAREVCFNRFLGNAKVTVEHIIEGWSEGTGAAAEGRHVLAIQDTSEINFTTTAERRRGLGETAKGNVHGLLLHPMLAVDAENGSLVYWAVRYGPATAAAPSRMTCETCRTRNRSAGLPRQWRPSRCWLGPRW